MPLRLWKCIKCGEEYRTKIVGPSHCLTPSELLISAPALKFMEKVNPETGKSALVGQQTILKERARAHSRDVEMDDLIQMNEAELAHQNGWLKKDGTKRKKIDDL